MKEIRLGEWEGKTPEQIDRIYDGGYSKWLNYPFRVLIPGAEKVIQFKKRAVKSIMSIVRNNSDRKLAVVTHGGVIVAYLSYLLKADFEKLTRVLEIDNTGLTEIEFYGARFVIKKINDLSHLIK